MIFLLIWENEEVNHHPFSPDNEQVRTVLSGSVHGHPYTNDHCVLSDECCRDVYFVTQCTTRLPD